MGGEEKGEGMGRERKGGEERERREWGKGEWRGCAVVKIP